MNYATLSTHPLAALFRLMDEPELESLKASIRTNGIREPIRLYEGKILDGRNRYKAAQAVGYNLTEADFTEFVGTTEEAEAYVLDTNASRRQMSDADKADLIKRMLARYPRESDRHIARLCGVSHVTVAKYRAPPTDKVFDKFAKDWGSLTDSRRKRFAEKFKAELRELWTD
jgi:ParB-like chromosome segregation protein Spo0J